MRKRIGAILVLGRHPIPRKLNPIQMKNQTTKGRLMSLLLGLLIFTLPVQAQYYGGNGKIEIGLGVGPMFALTDLGGSAGIGRGFLKDLDVPQAKASAGIYVTAHPTEWFGIRVAATIGSVAANDADAPIPALDPFAAVCEFCRGSRGLRG